MVVAWRFGGVGHQFRLDLPLATGGRLAPASPAGEDRSNRAALLPKTCLERIGRRHAAEPSAFDPPARFMIDPRILAVFDFVEAIDESQAMLVEAERTVDDVYMTVAPCGRLA
jgi:hypothetical protein